MVDGMTNEERKATCKFAYLCKVPVELCHECKAFSLPDERILGRPKEEIERMQRGKIR